MTRFNGRSDWNMADGAKLPREQQLTECPNPFCDKGVVEDIDKHGIEVSRACRLCGGEGFVTKED